MANLKLKSQFNFGKYKGFKIKEVIDRYGDEQYFNWLHESHYNIKFTQEVFDYIDELKSESYHLRMGFYKSE
jgi:hypothetical protein